MRIFVIFTFVFFSLCVHLAVGGIFRRYVRKHRPAAPRIPHHVNMLMSRSRMMGGPPLIERQFRIRQHLWPMYVRRPRAPPLMYYQSLQGPLMLQTVQPLRPSSRASRRLRFHDRLDMSASSRVPQFHHQPLSARHHLPIGMSSTTRLPTSAAVVPPWRPLDYGNPIDRDPTYDYAPPAIERVRFVTEVRGRGQARANNGMLGMYSRPSPVVVPAPWAVKRENMPGNHVRSRHPAAFPVIPQQAQHYAPLPPPPRGAHPLWKILAHKQRQRRPLRPTGLAVAGQVKSQQQAQAKQPHVPVRFLGQDPHHPLYHHQVFQRPSSIHSQEAEVFPHIPNIVYFKPTDVSKTSYAKKTPVKKGPFKQGFVSSANLYSKEVTSSSEFRPVKRPTTRPTPSSKKASGNKAYQFTVVGFRGPPSTTPMSPVAAAPSTSTAAPATTRRSPSVLYAVKTTPETLSTTHNSVVKPLEPTESLEPEDEAAEASELRPVHMLPSPSILDDIDTAQVEDDGREQGGLDVDFDNLDEGEQQQGEVPPQTSEAAEASAPVVPNSFNVFESLMKTFEEQFGKDEEDEDLEEEILNLKETHSNSHHSHHQQRIPVFEPAEESTLRGVLGPAEIVTTPAPSRKDFETSTSVSVSVGVSSFSSTSSKSQNGKTQKKELIEDEQVDDIPEDTYDGLFANIRTVPTTSTTARTTSSTTTTTTTEKPTTTEKATTTTVSTSTAYPRLPTMPTYKRKPKPVYAPKSSKAGGLLSKYSSSSSSVSKEVNTAPVPNGSGEVVIITAGRSKVKEYKPQVIANQTHLLAFDKVVADGEGAGVKESPIVLSSSADYASSPSSTSTTKSPLEDFDAMQLLHSWLNKS